MTSKSVNCPSCGTSVEWIASSKWRPFCCERCKVVDLGAWASEDYSVASSSLNPMEDIDYEQMPDRQ